MKKEILIAILGLIFAFCSCIAAVLVVPEVRRFLRLDRMDAVTQQGKGSATTSNTGANIPPVSENTPSLTLTSGLPTSTVTITVPPIPTATKAPAIEPGDVLYNADWSQGMDGWALDKSWKWVNGMLVNDGTENNAFATAPYVPENHNIDNYLVEGEIQVISMDIWNRDDFAIIARWSDTNYLSNYPDLTGYWAGYGESRGAVAFLGTGDPDPYEPLKKVENTVDNEWHTYSLRVFGNELRFSIDGHELLYAVDNKFLDGGKIRLLSNDTVLNVKRFQVVAQ